MDEAAAGAPSAVQVRGGGPGDGPLVPSVGAPAAAGMR